MTLELRTDGDTHVIVTRRFAAAPPSRSSARTSSPR